jgi:c-di-GMP-binding flagellar brake protein YcgR
VTEKRCFERFDSSFETRYAKSQHHVTISSLSCADDIGLGGVRANLSRTVDLKDTILMELRFSDKIRIATLAKVVWLKPDLSNGHNICGLKFLWISSREILDERLSSLRDEVEAIIR